MLFRTTPNALPDAEFAAIRAWAASSVHVGDSPLAGTFMASRGFGVTFTRAGLPALAERFAELEPYFSLTIGRSRELATLWERMMLRYERRSAEAFYFNLLSVPAGAGVGRHVDATLDWVTGVPGTTPLLVTVLYLNAPADGGTLELWKDDAHVASITPRENTLVCFRGDLGHEVKAVGTNAEGARTSLVCEHYAVTPEQAAKVPPLKLHSVGLFGRILAQKRNQGA